MKPMDELWTAIDGRQLLAMLYSGYLEFMHGLDWHIDLRSGKSDVSNRR